MLVCFISGNKIFISVVNLLSFQNVIPNYNINPRGSMIPITEVPFTMSPLTYVRTSGDCCNEPPLSRCALMNVYETHDCTMHKKESF
jgi:hypothetical protein